MESSLPSAATEAAHLAISALVVESFHLPLSAKESSNLSRRLASPSASVSPCIMTLTAKSAALPSPDSKIFRFSNSSKSPLISKAASTSLSAWVFALAKDLFFSFTRCITRSYARFVSKLTFTLSRSLRSVSARSVNSFFVFLPETSFKYLPETSITAQDASRAMLSKAKSPLSLLIELSKN